MADDNPFLPSKLQTLGMMLSGLGSGISAASARNLPAYYGIAPGAQAFTNSYGNLLARGANYDLQSKRLGLEQENADVTKQYREAQIAELKRQADIDAALMKGLPGLVGGGVGGGQMPGMRVPKPAMGPDFGAAIKANESGGNYSAIGPDTGHGRAYGAYQVMDFNIGPWTQEVLGKAMTPQEFLANPQAQDAVFKAKFGQYVNQYGSPQDAASVWFSGKPLTGNTAADVTGTTVPQYVQRFNRNLYGSQTPPPGQPDTSFSPAVSPTGVPAVSPPGAAPAGASTGVPPLPGPPPNNLDLAPYAMSKRFAPVATMIANNRNAQYGYDKFRYQAAVTARQNAATNANQPVSLDPNTGLPSTNQSVVGAAAAKKQAETQAEVAGRKEAIFGGPTWQTQTPEDFRKSADPELIALADGLNSGQLRLSQLGTRTGTGGATISKNDVIAAGQKLYGDGFNPDAGDMRFTFEQKAADPSSNLGKTLFSINTVYKHLDRFQDLVVALNNKDTPVANEVLKAWNNATGNPKYTTPEALKQALATEIARTIKGEGLNQEEVQNALNTLSTTGSTPQMTGALEILRHAMGDRESTIIDSAESHYVPQARINNLVGKSARKAIDHFDSVQQGLANPQTQTDQIQAQFPPPPQEAVNLLKMRPNTRDQFDAMFGPGAAAKVLGK